MYVYICQIMGNNSFNLFENEVVRFEGNAIENNLKRLLHLNSSIGTINY